MRPPHNYNVDPDGGHNSVAPGCGAITRPSASHVTCKSIAQVRDGCEAL
jgi:hypothetical protein